MEAICATTNNSELKIWKEQYYMMDFIQLLNQGYLKLFTLVKDND
jgi:hypothetical protein